MTVKTREQLYEMLKAAKPELAIGKSRARREELERLLGADIGTTKKSVVRRLKPAPAPFTMTAEQRDRILQTLDLVEAARIVIDSAPLSIDNLAHLVSIASREVDVSPGVAKIVLTTFFNLRASMTQKSAA